MSHDRGEYRAIRRVLLDGPDFQRLSAVARWVFVALKLNLGPAGIDVFYPDALRAQLVAQTGVNAERLTVALDELDGAGWIRRESNVLWVVGQLDNDPHVKASDPKHRKSIVRHVAGLPRIEIVKTFIKAHAGFIPPKDEASKALQWAFEGPSKGHRSTDNKNKDKDKPDNKPELPPAGADGRNGSNGGGWPTRLALVWSEQVGDVRPGRLGAALKSSVDRNGEERVERAMRAYVAHQKRDLRPCKLAWFAENAEVWIEKTASPVDAVDGELSPTLNLMTGGSSRGAA